MKTSEARVSQSTMENDGPDGCAWPRIEANIADAHLFYFLQLMEIYFYGDGG